MERDAQILLFRSLFAGRTDVYGTFNPRSGRAWQMKVPVTTDVVRAHLDGERPLAVYPLVGETVFFAVVDFDSGDGQPPVNFCHIAWRLGLYCYLERSKSKGFHVWTFFDAPGVSAAKARVVIKHILSRLRQPETEVFPKHDRLSGVARYGNFINLPLFGAFAGAGRMVFVDRNLETIPDQWQFMTRFKRVPADSLDGVMRKHNLRLRCSRPIRRRDDVPERQKELLPCAQRMLQEGVKANQRVACFRLAVQLRKAGNPYDRAVATLCAWAQRNRPADGKPIIRESEIRSQARWAYRGGYKSCGCEDPAVMPFCDPACPIRGPA